MFRKQGDLQVWWIPQVPGESFTVKVGTVTEGVKVMNILADYDRFQYENMIKPDYSNAGGLCMFSVDVDGEGTSGWEDWVDDVTGEDDPVKYAETFSNHGAPKL